jgi:hypothetical protein
MKAVTLPITKRSTRRFLFRRNYHETLTRIKKAYLRGIVSCPRPVAAFLTGQIPEDRIHASANAIPVLLCDFFCGWPYGLAVGL